MPSRDPSRRAASWLVLIVLAATCLSASAATPPRSGATKTAPRPAGTGRLPAGKALPDSVLATIGNGRVVTTSAFRKGWALVGAPRPESITPEDARQFLDLLIDKEILASKAIEETWEWSSVESAQVANLSDRTMMRVALDRDLAEQAKRRAARGDSALHPEALGIAARESTVAKLDVTYDAELTARLAKAWATLPKPSADSSIWSRLRVMGQLPVIEASDSMRVVAWSKAGSVKSADLIEAWKKLNPLVRPRVETPEQVHDLVKNNIYEHVLRRNAEAEHLEKHPLVEQAVQRQREFLASQYFVNREVYSKVPSDEATLKRFYDQAPAVWDVPARLNVVRMVLPDRSEATTMALTLRNAAEAESLVARGARQRVDYATEINARTDSALFARAMKSGTGTVLGPDSVSGGWQVVRVNAVLPSYSRPFTEVKELVARAWSDQESERRMVALLAGMRKRTKVVVNERGLQQLVRAPMKAPAAQR